MPAILWQFLALELPKEQNCGAVLEIIARNAEEYFKTSDQKSYILPLLTCISKELEPYKCSQLLDQIVEINGESWLEKVARESKLSGNFLESYLKKWGIQCA